MQQDNSSFWTDIKRYEEQLAKSPNSFCFANLSEVYLKVGLIDDALHTARQGIAKHPGYLRGLRALAMVCHAKGVNDECLTALKLVTVAMPEDQQAQMLLARLLADAGDREAARQAFQTVLEFAPDDVESLAGLESIEISAGSGHPLLHEDVDVEDEIIEDLEELEELDVFEEDQPDSGLIDEEQLLAAEPTTETHHDPLSTATLAELYVKQGFTRKALEIYRSILADDPGNSAVSTRIAELEQLDTPVAATYDDDTFEYESDTALLSNVFAVEPDTVALSEIPLQGEAFFASPPESISAVVIPHGTADNALSTLEGWLENIGRLKSCR